MSCLLLEPMLFTMFRHISTHRLFCPQVLAFSLGLSIPILALTGIFGSHVQQSKGLGHENRIRHIFISTNSPTVSTHLRVRYSHLLVTEFCYPFKLSS